MVQYGGGQPSVRSGGSNHLFQAMSSARLNLRTFLLLLVAVCILRNLLKNDYRRDEYQYLRESGMSEKQIEQYIPGLAVGREKDDELQNIKKDIAYLMKEVEDLKAGREPSKENSSDHGLGESLRSMDSIHEQKRRMKEEQLLRDHPDFKPSKRLKDTISGLQREID